MKKTRVTTIKLSHEQWLSIRRLVEAGVVRSMQDVFNKGLEMVKQAAAKLDK